MPPRAASTPSGLLQQRLDTLRGGAAQRSANVRTLAAFAQHADCGLATLGFAARIDFDSLLAGTRYAVPSGQSPFAITRGNSFENLLRIDDYAATRELMHTLLGVAPDEIRIQNLRHGYPPNSLGMTQRAAATLELLRGILAGDPASPHLIDGAVLAADVGGVLAHFEADALAALARGEIRVAEVKSFPKVDDRVDPEKLGAALDQVAVYLLLVRAAVSRLGGDPDALVSERALLITPRNVGLQPVLSEQRVTARINRIHKLLAAIPRTDDVVAAAPAGASFGPVADRKASEAERVEALAGLADAVGVRYGPGCLSTCGNARFCRERAFNKGETCVSGMAAVRLLPNVLTLYRAEELTHGNPPDAAEAPAAALLERAGRLYDTLGPTPPAISTRRPA